MNSVPKNLVAKNLVTKNPATTNPVSQSRTRHGYFAALAGSLVGTFIGVLTAGFLAALMLGLAGLVGTTLNTLLWLVPVPVGAALGCGVALRAEGQRGAVFTALVLLAFIGVFSTLLSVWLPLELETLWALRAVWLAALVPLTCAARGLVVLSGQSNARLLARKLEPN